MQPSLGKMSAYKILSWQDRAASSIEQTVAPFLEIGEAVATRWIQTAKGVLLLQMVPGDDASGAIYVFDRRHDQWYMLYNGGGLPEELPRNSTGICRPPWSTSSARILGSRTPSTV